MYARACGSAMIHTQHTCYTHHVASTPSRMKRLLASTTTSSPAFIIKSKTFTCASPFQTIQFIFMMQRLIRNLWQQTFEQQVGAGDNYDNMHDMTWHGRDVQQMDMSRRTAWANELMCRRHVHAASHVVHPLPRNLPTSLFRDQKIGESHPTHQHAMDV